MGKIIKNNVIYGGVPDEVITAWETEDVQDLSEIEYGDSDISGIGDGSITGAIAEHEEIIGNTSISGIGNGTLTGAVSTLNSKLTSTSLTLTRTNNNYVDATSFGRMAAWKKSGILYLRGNLGPSSAVPNGSGDITIGTISGWNAVSDVFLIVPMQSGSGHLGVTVKANGTIQIYNTCGTAVSGFCRFNVCVPEA